MSVHGEFRRVLGNTIEFLVESEARGANDCAQALQRALAVAVTDLSASAEQALACLGADGAARRVEFPRADQRERFAENADHLVAICNAVLGRGDSGAL